MEVTPRESQPERFDFNNIMHKFLHKDPSLRFVRVNTLAEGEQYTPMQIIKSRWESVTSTRAGEPDISLGGKQLPEDKDRLFQWGAATESEQLLVKAAHECAHVHQIANGLDKALENYLNNIPQVLTREQSSYIELYNIFTTHGPVTGLSTEGVYARQSQEAHMNVHALEDITELLGAFMLDDEYFLWRLNRLATFSDEDRMEIVNRISVFAPN